MKNELLLLHGALGSKKQLEPIKELLSSIHKVYSMDFAGHGDNVEDCEFSIELFTNNVIDYLNEHSLDKVDIFGYSMGGYVAMHLAKHHPERVNKIVTLGTKLDWSLSSAEKEVKMLNPEIIEAKVPHFAEKLRNEHKQDWKNVMRKTAELMLGMAKGKKLFDSDFSSIMHEVIIGIGDQDKMVSINESEHVAQLLPNAILKVLAGIEHPLDKVDPQIINRYIIVSL